MSKFTEKTKNKNVTINEAGGKAFKITNEKLKLITQVFTSFFKEPKYYGDNSDDIVSTIRNVAKTDPLFIAQLAKFARKEMHLRSISHVLVAELAKECKGESFVKEAISDVCLRTDDTYEILGYYINAFGKPIPNSIKKGIAKALTKFDEYQLAKYQGKGKKPSLADTIKLCHPIKSTLFKQVIEGNIKVPETWETIISSIKKEDTNAVRKAWEGLVESNKLPYMATLRNLRNLLNNKISNYDKVLSYITNEKAVLNSKQMPFRYLAAFNQIGYEANQNSKVTQNALSKALEISVENIDKFNGNTAIIYDLSGSMESYVSSKSGITYMDIATLFAAMSEKVCENSVLIPFGQIAKIKSKSSEVGIINKMQHYKINDVGHSTNLYKAFEVLIKNKIKVDRVIVFSDMQAYGDSAADMFNRYKSEFNKDCILHSVDLCGYGTSQFKPSFNKNNINLIAGWNEKIFTWMHYFEMGESKIVELIQDYK